MCCDQKRSAIKADGTSYNSAVKVLYSGQVSVQVRGAITGKIYQFPKHEPVQFVDPRDAASMMQTRMFRQVQ